MANPHQLNGANASIITNSIPPLDPKGRVEWIKTKQQPAVRFGLASSKGEGIPDLNTKLSIEQMLQTTVLFNHLENDTQMSPELNRAAGIETWLLMFNNKPKFYFPEDVKQRANDLLQRFQGENWGAPAAVDNPSNSDSAEEVASPSITAATAAHAAMPAAPRNTTATIMRFPADDEVWGRRGIMHDILPKVSGGVIRSRIIDPDYRRPTAKVSGENGLAVGDWWPFRLCALRDGAHGESQAGISGSIEDGAHSIVVAGAYEGVDEDRGDVIWYSAPGSADTENRNETTRSSGTDWLSRSLVTRNPVRVLRSANRKSAYAPSVGLRYDGLYVVVEQDTSRNDKGGLFIRYRLRRLPNQKPLVDVRRDSPTAQQMADFRRAKNLL